MTNVFFDLSIFYVRMLKQHAQRGDSTGNNITMSQTWQKPQWTGSALAITLNKVCARKTKIKPQLPCQLVPTQIMDHTFRRSRSPADFCQWMVHVPSWPRSHPNRLPPNPATYQHVHHHDCQPRTPPSLPPPQLLKHLLMLLPSFVTISCCYCCLRCLHCATLGFFGSPIHPTQPFEISGHAARPGIQLCRKCNWTGLGLNCRRW